MPTGRPSPSPSKFSSSSARCCSAKGRYQESLEAYRNAVKVAPPDWMRRARGGVIQSALRVAQFESAREEAEQLVKESPRAPGDRWRCTATRSGHQACSNRRK